MCLNMVLFWERGEGSMYICLLGFIETLQEIFKVIFDEVLTPILTDVLMVVIDLVGNTLMDIFGELLLQGLVILLKIVDFLESIFDIFSGNRDVGVNGHSMDLLSAFFSMDKVKMAFLMVTILAVGMAFLFTIATVAKSISDMTLDNKRPVGKVLGSGMKAALTFALVPFMAVFFLQLSTLVVRGVNSQMVAAQVDGGKPPTMGTVIFLTGSMNAAKHDVENPGFTDSIRGKYYKGQVEYTDMDRVKKDFDPAKFDIVICSVCTILVIIILICGIFLFIQRIFDVLLLYVVSPLFVSTMPFDDGAAFGKWRDLFVAKLFSGFGVIFTMKLYLMLVPLLTGNSISLFSDRTIAGYAVINSMLKMFIVIGGAWAAFKAQHLFLQVLHPEAARSARMATAMMMGAVAGAVTGGAGMAAAALSHSGSPGSILSRKGRRVVEESRSMANVKAMEEASSKSQAFRG